MCEGISANDEEFETTDDSMTEEKINDKENSFMSMSMDEKKTQQERQVTKKILMDKVVRNKYIKLKMKIIFSMKKLNNETKTSIRNNTSRNFNQI